MKTALVALFQAINDAKRELITERDKPHTPAERTKIRQAITILDQLASDVLVLDIIAQADEIDAQAQALKDLTAKINKTSDNLAHIAAVLDDITNKIDAVLKVASVLSGAGLLAG